MVKKKSKKINKPKPQVNPPTPAAQEEDINDIVKKADSVVIITETRGNIEIRALKNVTFAWQVKGLLVGALDKYLVTPINHTLRQVNDGHINLYKQLLVEIQKLTGNKNEKTKEE